MLPKTNATLLNNQRNDNFYLSGYGVHTLAGLNISFFEKARFAVLRYKPNTFQGLLSNKVT